MKDKKYIVHDGYIGTLVYYDNGFPIYRFKGGECVGEGRFGFDTREAAEKYALETYGHAD
jgi:hypothetical protein